MDHAISSAGVSPNKVNPATVLPRAEWSTVLRETAIEVFATMAHATISPGDHAIQPPERLITAIVGIAGALRANLSLRGQPKSAARLALQMIGIGEDDPDSQKAALDAFGEISNIVAGYFKAKIGLGDACKLSVPTLIAGRSYQFRSSGSFDRIEIFLLYDGEPLWLTLEVAR